MTDHPGYRQAFLDWMACAFAGRHEPAVHAVAPIDDSLLERTIRLGVAGHVLDYDDTYAPGLSHLSAPVAPAALVLGAHIGSSVGSMLAAYAAGFEAMAALARAGHPMLYERGWHPTAITGTVGAATAAAHLLGLDAEKTTNAQLLAVLGAGGLRTAFGTDGKSLQVGMAASQGVQAAGFAANGATTSEAVRDGYESAYGARWAEPDPDDPAIEENWIKAFPCCLQTHAAIEAAIRASASQDANSAGSITVVVHPRSRQAAPLDDVATGLEAKFSIPYTTAFGWLYGPPDVRAFAGVDEAARTLATRIRVELDEQLPESSAVLKWDSDSIEIDAALGSPLHPMTVEQLDWKLRSLSGDRLIGILDDPRLPATEVLRLVVGE
ncbi:MAG: MmgE/PrpD family protein [Acidimicrobiia bacterium]|nr:MmgE/PrpD family protein [Acidimicrobiia bacterium]